MGASSRKSRGSETDDAGDARWKRQTSNATADKKKKDKTKRRCKREISFFSVSTLTSWAICVQSSKKQEGGGGRKRQERHNGQTRRQLPSWDLRQNGRKRLKVRDRRTKNGWPGWKELLGKPMATGVTC